jgi:hypothetical protein
MGFESAVAVGTTVETGIGADDAMDTGSHVYLVMAKRQDSGRRTPG